MMSLDISIENIAEQVVNRGKNPLKMDLSMFDDTQRIDFYNKVADAYGKRLAEENRGDGWSEGGWLQKEILKISKIYENSGNSHGMSNLADSFLENGKPVTAIECYRIADNKDGIIRVADKIFETGDSSNIKYAIRGYRFVGKLLSKEKLLEIGNGYMEKSNYRAAIEVYDFIEDGTPRENMLKAADHLLEKDGGYWYADWVYRKLGDKKGLTKVGSLYLRHGNKKDAIKIFKEVGRDDLVKLAKQL